MGDIRDFFSNSNILITGGTGFVGLCLIEKLLRCVPDVGTIYVLVRQKRKRPLKVRLNDLVKNRVFNFMRDRHGGTAQFEKLIGVQGDISKTNLELSDCDKKMLITNVNIVLHCAACLDFNENLRTAINVNMLGTKRIIDLCKEIENIKVLVHVSSAYVNTNRNYVKETLYPLVSNSDEIVTLIDNLDDKTLAHVMRIILNNSPNAYTFSKSLAEYEVWAANKSFPTAIVRPSMIIGAWKEPVPGWTSSKNGPQGYLMAAAKGIVRRLPVNKYIVYDYIPVDIVINAIIASAWYVKKNTPSETLILHCTTSTYKPFKWQDLETYIPQVLNKYPLGNAVWYPTLKLVSSMSWYKVSSIIFHLIPAYILDFLTRIFGRKPVLVKLHKNINKSLELLSPFIFTEWKYENTNTLMLHQALSLTDQQMFGVDVKDLNWQTYFNNLALGVRQYLNNENLNNLASAKKKHIFLWLLNIAVQIFFVYFLVVIVSVLSQSSLINSLWSLPMFVFFLYFL